MQITIDTSERCRFKIGSLNFIIAADIEHPFLDDADQPEREKSFYLPGMEKTNKIIILGNNAFICRCESGNKVKCYFGRTDEPHLRLEGITERTYNGYSISREAFFALYGEEIAHQTR